MFIDPKIQFPNDANSDQVTNPQNTGKPLSGTATKSGGVSSQAGEDTVSLSSTHGEVQTLKASLGSVPEVRSERVSSLRQQVSQGQYQPSSSKVADAIVQEYSNLNV